MKTNIHNFIIWFNDRNINQSINKIPVVKFLKNWKQTSGLKENKVTSKRFWDCVEATLQNNNYCTYIRGKKDKSAQIKDYSSLKTRYPNLDN